MPSIFSLAAAALLAAAPAVNAWEHYVTVGKGGNKYDPPFIHAEIGDVVKLEYFPMNHTLTQSPFETPCTAQPFGIDSGFKPVPDEHNTKWFEFEVKVKTPLWFYCRQAKHCSKDGMVFAVNPPADGPKTFDAFQKLAKQQNQDAPPPPSGGYHGSGSSPSYDQGSKYGDDNKNWGNDGKNWGDGGKNWGNDNKNWGNDNKNWGNDNKNWGNDHDNWGNDHDNSKPTEHLITVGKGGNKYDPPYITAKVGDKVKFQFFPKNHSLTQSSFDKPCTSLGYGIDSGFQPVDNDYSTKWFELTVKDENPTWFYCRQAQHCSKDGMVFAINAQPYGDKSFEAFQALAKQQKQDAPAPTNNHGSGSSPQYGNDNNNKGNNNWGNGHDNSKPTEHMVTVGKGGNKYDPPYVNAKVGDKIKFQFFPKNHSLTQSSFDKPCTALGYGIDSGFQPVDNDYSTKWFEVEVKDDKPTWFYCRQAQHCSKDGMVFAINAAPSGDKSFDAFQALAKQQHQDAPAAPSNNHGSGSSPSYGSSGNNYKSSGASVAGAAADGDSSDSGFGKWAPVVIGLLAANFAVGLILAVITILNYIRRDGRATTRSISVAYQPVREKENDTFSPLHPGMSYRDDARPYSEQ